ncbi:unnamed protein product [Effrenium voratum]|nr:unnamed protein product [Effrenium voratum]
MTGCLRRHAGTWHPCLSARNVKMAYEKSGVRVLVGILVGLFQIARLWQKLTFVKSRKEMGLTLLVAQVEEVCARKYARQERSAAAALGSIRLGPPNLRKEWLCGFPGPSAAAQARRTKTADTDS